MIEINITVVVQILHFLCAYWLMRVFLWKPAIARMDEYARQRNELKQSLQIQTELADNKKSEIARVWQQARQDFSVQAPVLTTRALTVRHEALTHEQKIPSVDREEVSALVHIIVQRAQQ